MLLNVNGTRHTLDDPWTEETLLDVLRERLGLVGAKYGCGVGLCGACTVLVDDVPQRACVLPVRSVGAAKVTTVEGLSDRGALHPVQRAWLEESVPQCGYCQAGQIVATVALLRSRPNPTDAEIDAALDGHLCRCGTQPRVRRAVKRAAGSTRS